jgi:hypothetical protein
MSEIRDLPDYLRRVAETIEERNAVECLPITGTMDVQEAMRKLRSILGDDSYFTFEVKLTSHNKQVDVHFHVYDGKKSFDAPTVTGVINAVLDAHKKPEVLDAVETAAAALNPMPFSRESLSCDPR